MEVSDRGFNFKGDKEELEAYFRLKREYLTDDDERNGQRIRKKEKDIFDHVPKSGGGPVENEAPREEAPEPVTNRPTLRKPKVGKLVKTSDKIATNSSKETDISKQIWGLATKDRKIKLLKGKPPDKRTKTEKAELNRAYMNARYAVLHSTKEQKPKTPKNVVAEPEDVPEPEQENEDSPNVSHACEQATGYNLKQMCHRYKYENSETGDALARKIVQGLYMGYSGMRLLDTTDILKAVRETLKEIEQEEKTSKED